MALSRHQIKVFFSSATIAAALIGSFILGTTSAQELTVTRIGDNVNIQGSSWAENRFYIGEILKGDMNDVTTTSNTSASVNATANTPVVNVSTNTNSNTAIQATVTNMSTADILDKLLGDQPEPIQNVTTVWQESTGAHWMTGIDDIPYGPAYTWARNYGITKLAPNSARMDSPILRYEFALMMMAYIKNVEGKTLAENTQCDIRKYADYNSMEASVKAVAQQACNTGLMGWKSHVGATQTITTLLPRFRPYDTMTEAEINIVASRYIPTTIRLMPTNNTRSAVIRFLYSIAPQAPDMTP